MRFIALLRSPAPPRRPLRPRRFSRGGARGLAGQSLIIFALANVVLMGALGLVLDGGYNVSQRRTMQNAADAAALKGAQDIHLNAISPSSPVTRTQLLADVKTAARENGLPNPDDATTGATLACQFVDNNSNVIGDCTTTPVVSPDAIPDGATGVKVTVSERHATFVMGVLGISRSGVGALAIAHVEAMKNTVYGASAGPFIVCGFNTYLASGGTMSIIVTDASGRATTNPPTVNSAAYGQTFVIHASNVANCDTQSESRFDGVANQDANIGRSIPGTIKYDPGAAAGPMRQAVAAIGGCDTVQTAGCDMVLPIADATQVDCGTCKQIYAVAWGVFRVTQVGANTHHGQFKSLEMNADSTRTWSKTANQSATVIRLSR